MSVYTTVTAEQLAAWLRGYRVGDLLELRGIPAGIENTNYFVTTTEGRYVLTLFEKLTPAELPYYLGLMAHLAERGVPSAHPIADARGSYLGELNGRPAALVVRLPGAEVRNPGAGQCATVGATLAHLHVAGADYAATMPNPRGPRWWSATAPLLERFLPAGEWRMLTDEIARQARDRADDLPRGAIHADLFRDNVLMLGDRVGGVIDFYFACTDLLLYDVAITVNDWCLADYDDASAGLDPTKVRALLDAYHARRPFTALEREAWPVMLRAGALRFWVSRLHDFHLPRPGDLVHAHDPAHFRDLLATHRAAASAAAARLEPLVAA
jgi:homoserine kinase type II